MHDSFLSAIQHTFFLSLLLETIHPTQAQDNKMFITIIPDKQKCICDNVHKHIHAQEKLEK